MRITFLALSLTLLVPAAASAEPKHPAKVVVIGMDGVSLNLLEPFAKQGVTPNMAKLMKEGARGHLASIWPLRTPQVWTSSVTGKLPGQHGIWDHLSNTYFNPPEVRTEEKKRVTVEQRRSKALWDILGAKGFKTLTVGWMASWPALPVNNGIMVAPIELMGDRRQTTIKGSFYKGAPKLVEPKKFAKRVDQLIVDPYSVKDSELAPYVDLPPKGSPLYSMKYLERYIYGIRWSVARARSVEAITLDLLPEAKPDVVLSYFQCSDSLLHRFWIFSEGPDAVRVRLKGHGFDATHSEELAKRFGNVVEACYRDIDARLGRILAETQGPDTLVLVISDHGFGPAPVPHKMKGEPFSGDHLDDGVILAKGPGIAGGSIIKDMGILDVTPTLLHALGQPVAEDMRGHVVTSISSGMAGGALPKRIPSYESKPQLEAIHPKGWPPRKKPRRSAADL